MASLISSSSGAGCFSRSSVAASTMPGAQKPHWNELCLRNDFCSGVGPFVLRPSTRRDLVAVGLDREDRQLRTDLAVEQDRARAAVAALAADLRALHAELVAQDVEEDVGGFDVDGARLAVQCQSDDCSWMLLISALGLHIRPLVRPFQPRDRGPQPALQHHADHVHPVFLRRADVGDRGDDLRDELHGLLDQVVRQTLAARAASRSRIRGSASGATEPNETRYSLPASAMTVTLACARSSPL